MKTKIVELVTGEKLVATVTYDGPNYLNVKDVFVLMARGQPDKITGNIEMGLAPWPIFKKSDAKEFTINSSAITLSYDAREDIADSYSKAKSSLILPTSLIHQAAPAHPAATPQQAGIEDFINDLALLNEGV